MPTDAEIQATKILNRALDRAMPEDLRLVKGKASRALLAKFLELVKTTGLSHEKRPETDYLRVGIPNKESVQLRVNEDTGALQLRAHDTGSELDLPLIFDVTTASWTGEEPDKGIADSPGERRPMKHGLVALADAVSDGLWQAHMDDISRKINGEE